MIGCSFVVDREYFGEIGLLDPGMEVYGGENIELGMRVRRTRTRLSSPVFLLEYTPMGGLLSYALKYRHFFFT